VSFAPEYIRSVLDQNFEDAKRLFAGRLLAIHRAHLVMLAAQGIVARDDAHAIRVALDRLRDLDLTAARYDGSCEDLFFYVDRLIAAECGEVAAGRLHTARSRNDIDMTMYRMQQRDLILALAEVACELRGALLDVADRHQRTVLAVHTHTQRAQPTTLAHYLLGVVEQLERDAARLRAAYGRTNCCPLGACAVAGTGFAIDRRLTAELLGFDGPTGNTYGSIAAVDYQLEAVAAAAVLAAGLGRFVQDLLLWCTSEVGYVRLADGFVQSSSIMPQKRNPVALEHVRAIASRALGQAQAVFAVVHNTPFGDIVDTEDDLQPLVATVFRDAGRAVSLTAAALSTAEFSAGRMEASACEGWTALTELADRLVRDHGVPLRTAHAIAARLMEDRSREPQRPLGDILRRASIEVGGAPLDYADEEVARLLDPRHFVEVRATFGGPAPEEIRRALVASRAALGADREWRGAAAGALREAERRLMARSAEL